MSKRTTFRVAVLACSLLVSGGTVPAASAQAPQSVQEQERIRLQDQLDTMRASLLATTDPSLQDLIRPQVEALDRRLTELNRAELQANTAALEAGATELAETLATSQPARYRHRGSAPLNDLRVTPGAVDPDLTVEKLCTAGFHTAADRHVTESLKKRICAEYGQTGRCPGPSYEIDHLISIELGGSNDASNLWPQPVDAKGVVGFHTKDKVENALHRKVCAGEVSLPAAQKCIAADWYSCAVKEGILPDK